MTKARHAGDDAVGPLAYPQSGAPGKLAITGIRPLSRQYSATRCHAGVVASASRADSPSDRVVLATRPSAVMKGLNHSMFSAQATLAMRVAVTADGGDRCKAGQGSDAWTTPAASNRMAARMVRNIGVPLVDPCSPWAKLQQMNRVLALTTRLALMDMHRVESLRASRRSPAVTAMAIGLRLPKPCCVAPGGPRPDPCSRAGT